MHVHLFPETRILAPRTPKQEYKVMVAFDYEIFYLFIIVQDRSNNLK